MTERRDRFQFGPRDRRGVIAGIRASQLAIVGSSLVASVFLIRAVRGPLGALVATLGVLSAVAAVSWPIGGRALDEWVPVAARFGVQALVGANREVAPAGATTRTRRRPPGELSRFSVQAVETATAGTLAVLCDRRFQRASAVVALGGEAFALLSDADRRRRIDGWASVLSGITRDAGAATRLQWIERTVPDGLDTLRSYLERFATSDSTLVGLAEARASYEELIRHEAETALAHERYLVVTVKTSTSRSRRSGPSNSWSEALGQEMLLLAQRCQRADLDVVGTLSLSGLSRMISGGFSTAAQARALEWPWPMSFESDWTAAHADGLFHATFWVAEWPRHEVADEFLLPLLAGTGWRRTVSVTMVPVPPDRAVRKAEHARTSRAADAELKMRHGFAATARSRREDEAVVRREHELAAGHGAYRYSAYVTVSASDREVLERSCRQVLHASALSGLELRRLYGAQAEAFCCTLPVGRGCD